MRVKHWHPASRTMSAETRSQRMLVVRRLTARIRLAGIAAVEQWHFIDTR